MVPLQLSVRNFMCYGEGAPPLGFEGIHVACLCGDNGHGKTALLDAICWALWGTARATLGRNGAFSHPNMGELVHIGKPYMSVELDFTARGQRYRVVRRHSLPARGSGGRTTLELQVQDADAPDAFRPISGNTVNETNRRIRQILNMDFKTFINTAYLAQGQADAFTTSTPTERKRCLIDVLDLHYYQRLSDAARQRSNAIHDDIRQTDAAISVHGEEAAKKPQHERALMDARSRIAELQPALEDSRQRGEQLRNDVQTLQAQQAESDALRQRKRQAQADADAIGRQLDTDAQRLADYDAIIANAQQTQDGFAAFQRTQAAAARLDDALSQKTQLDAERAAVAQGIARQEERLSADIANLQRRISAELMPKSKRLHAIQNRFATLDRRRAELEERIKEIEHQRSRMDTIAMRQSALEQENISLLQTMADTRKKFDMLNEGIAVCPLCDQNLEHHAQQHLRREYKRVGTQSRASHDTNTSEIGALKAEHSGISEKLRRLEASHQSSGRWLAADEANIIRDRDEAMQAAAELKLVAANLAELERRLKDTEFAQQERQELARLDGALTALGYDAAAHQQARAALQATQHFADDHRRLEEAQANRPAIDESLQTNRLMLQSRTADLAAANNRLAALEVGLETLPSQQRALADAIADEQRLASALQERRVEEGVLLNHIARCEALEQQIEALRQERKRLSEQQGVYTELTAAFGKDGIQALIIESAIPQIQDDANDILSRITENRMHLRLELDEGTSERLEIRIADELGTRDYQTFSGGEAFRINFALRIALSKLLARRSGAPLPVLFIDEGFGSQDRSGQERITEAIQSIQDDFEKIIVITHIDEVKQAFPIRIEVTKRDGGSTFAIA